jgi:hypothetical protein
MRWRSEPDTGSARLLVRLQLLLERGQLGEWRVRIGLAIAVSIAAPLDVFGAQLRVPIRPITAWRAIGSFAASLSVRSIAPDRTFVAFSPRPLIALRPLPIACDAIRTLARLGKFSAIGPAVAALAVIRTLPRCRRSLGGRRGCGGVDAKRSRRIAGIGDRRRLRPTRLTLVARLARTMIVTTAGSPDFDEFLCRRRACSCDFLR